MYYKHNILYKHRTRVEPLPPQDTDEVISPGVEAPENNLFYNKLYKDNQTKCNKKVQSNRKKTKNKKPLELCLLELRLE